MLNALATVGVILAFVKWLGLLPALASVSYWLLFAPLLAQLVLVLVVLIGAFVSLIRR